MLHSAQTCSGFIANKLINSLYNRATKIRTYDDCSYHQIKTPIRFWCRLDMNPGPILDNKRLY